MTKRPLKILLAFCAISLVAQAQDAEPDFKKEERFHNIYKRYNEHPTSPEVWEKVLADRKAKTYTIQNKDTLWDVSQTFFGDSNYWPKVWSYNTEGILNPHEINPNQVIRFYAGTFEEAPTVGLAVKTAEPESLPDRVIEKHQDGTVEAIKIPPTKRIIRPVVKKLPPSIPLYRLGAVNTPPPEFQKSKPRKITLPQKYLSVYAMDREVPSVGEVVEIEVVDGESASEFQYITVRLSNASSKHLVAYNDSNRVRDPDQLLSSVPIVEIQGEIEVLERVNSSGDLYRAFIHKTVDPVRVGAKLMPGSMEMFEVSASAPVTSVQARVIGGESAKYQKIFGDDEFVFLSAGAKEGLLEGSTLQVYMNERARKPGTKTILNDRVIGSVKILKLGDHFATAYVLASETNIVVGDYVGGTTEASASSSDSLEETTSDKATDPALNSEDSELQL